jgi:hypothetical protein
MSDAVRLSSKLPKDDETNGLDALGLDLTKRPEEIRCAVIWFDVAKITTETDSHAVIPTVRIRKIEPVEPTATIRKTVEKAFSARTGRAMLPLEEAIDQLDLD